MNNKKFDIKKINKLNNPERALDISATKISKKLNLNDIRNIVEIGAGTGFFSVMFSKIYTDSDIFALDVSEFMVNWMKDNILKKFPNIIPKIMEENIIPLKSNIADLVYTITVHHELNDPEKLLKECFRILKNNTKIFIIDWKKEYNEQGPPSKIKYKTKQVKDQLIKVGFSNIRTKHLSKKYYFIIAEKH